MNSEEQIKDFLKNNYGYITTKDILKLGISKPLIRKYLVSGLIEKVSHGLYMDKNLFKDEYYILQKKYPEAIFSYNTAFHILNLTNRTPMEIEITVLRNKKIRGNYKVHWVSEKYYKIGIIEMESPLGNPVRFDVELQNRILDYYFRSKDKDIDLLLEYAKIFNIYDKVNTIIEVMMKW